MKVFAKMKFYLIGFNVNEHLGVKVDQHRFFIAKPAGIGLMGKGMQVIRSPAGTIAAGTGYKRDRPG
ncbi:hypothetical protein, partial [Enterobacter hormaechei]